MDIDIKTLLSVKHFIRLIKDKYEIGGVVLFGSRARGTHGDDSDVDLAIIVKGPPGDFVATKLDMASHAYDSMLETDVIISPMPIWESEWRDPQNYSDPQLIYNIKREGVVLEDF